MSGQGEAREQIARWLFDFTMRRDRNEVRWADQIGAGALSDETLRRAWRSEADCLLGAAPAVAEALAAVERVRELAERWDRDETPHLQRASQYLRRTLDSQT